MSSGRNRYPQFPIRTDPILIEKIRYIGLENSRSAGKEIEQLIIKHIKQYEAEYGEITLDDLARLRDKV